MLKTKASYHIKRTSFLETYDGLLVHNQLRKELPHDFRGIDDLEMKKEGQFKE